MSDGAGAAFCPFLPVARDSGGEVVLRHRLPDAQAFLAAQFR
jgi:hypothetical protein